MGAMQDQTRESLRYSIYDGVLANMFATLTGGVFLTGFAVYLGMNEFTIGLLGAMPFLVTIFQLPAAYFVQNRGNRKKVSVRCSLVARTMWVPILVVALLPVPSASIKVPIVLALIFLHYALGSASFVAWLSWMSDLVPDRMRGNFFGTRNMLAGAASMLVMVIFGTMLDGLRNLSSNGLPLGFSITFLTAVLFGVASIHFLRRVSEPVHTSPAVRIDFGGQLLLPFRDRNFRRFLGFSFFWSFSVYFASPFFALYFLRDLGYGYGFIATLGMLSAFADLVGMRLWGKLSDTTRNKPIVYFAGWGAIFLPLAWVSCQAGEHGPADSASPARRGDVGRYQPVQEQPAAANLPEGGQGPLPFGLQRRRRARGFCGADPRRACRAGVRAGSDSPFLLGASAAACPVCSFDVAAVDQSAADPAYRGTGGGHGCTDAQGHPERAGSQHDERLQLPASSVHQRLRSHF